LPDKTDWVKQKEALAKSIEKENLHIGEYYFNQLLENRNYRIRERIIERDALKRELYAIRENQKRFHLQLTSTDKLNDRIFQLNITIKFIILGII
jgi:hypothetical protein